jgi:hypothetical protein
MFATGSQADDRCVRGTTLAESMTQCGVAFG